MLKGITTTAATTTPAATAAVPGNSYTKRERECKSKAWNNSKSLVWVKYKKCCKVKEQQKATTTTRRCRTHTRDNSSSSKAAQQQQKGGSCAAAAASGGNWTYFSRALPKRARCVFYLNYWRWVVVVVIAIIIVVSFCFNLLLNEFWTRFTLKYAKCFFIQFLLLRI